MKRISFILFFILICFSSAFLFSQPPVAKDFISYQKGIKKINDVFGFKEDTLKKQFAAAGLKWPAKYMYIRSFKYDSEMEVWVKSDRKELYKLFKRYKVCALAGTLGPKRMEGDYQVPEGFYYINQFKPNSSYHLALGLNYPNASDCFLSDSLQPGSDIYVHGSCVTVGCIPINDDQIEELYLLASIVHGEGQDFIPIHVFPVSFKNKKSVEALNKYLELHPDYQPLLNKMKYAYYYFNQKKKLPITMIDKNGNYLFADEIKISFAEDEDTLKAVKVEVPRKTATKVNFNETNLSKTFYKQAITSGGIKGFQRFLDSLSSQLSQFLPKEKNRTFVQVEFIVDTTGKIILPKVLSGATAEMNNMIIDSFEAMPHWIPAVDVEERPVAVKLQQVIEVKNKKITL